MGSSWSGFGPQNEMIKLQWAALEMSEFEVTEREFKAWLALLGLSQSADMSDATDTGEGESDSG